MGLWNGTLERKVALRSEERGESFFKSLELTSASWFGENLEDEAYEGKTLEKFDILLENVSPL